MTTAHKTAFSGLQEIYDLARPRYPKKALDHICGLLPQSAGVEKKHLLDVGCGTGILTRQLRDACRDFKITGCDLNEDMISQARASDKKGRTNAETGAIEWHISPAETLPFASDSINLITVAQAAQWFVRPQFYTEAQRLLNPTSGRLVILENNRNLEASAFMEDYEALIETHNPTYSRNYRGFDYAGEMASAGFKQVETHNVPWTRTMEQANFVQMAKSSTKVQAAIEASGGEFLTHLSMILQRHWGRAGSVNVAYTTALYCGKV
ncbi:class I SAM-dependent methyltransferase [Pseudovibrio sp. Tun.PSC04-5.I4]|uniref:class I SAM-dependent methyltransferase n=1 Tax=Pseudovibrio sp. Tun.PSC04-5.I4 TaxID=1798213 RepID=UPI00088F70B7|nr:class I SAM-dependent methyltransferase [Pseudovibrio sp. Tun.PSC04-5.I4]SDQ72864.1 Ubiquinone/menaquinone biosynthesis C-methylase UbiE [Pseudovibrio sp. Tun.PSC04-5.I4]